MPLISTQRIAKVHEFRVSYASLVYRKHKKWLHGYLRYYEWYNYLELLTEDSFLVAEDIYPRNLISPLRSGAFEKDQEYVLPKEKIIVKISQYMGVFECDLDTPFSERGPVSRNEMPIPLDQPQQEKSTNSGLGNKNEKKVENSKNRIPPNNISREGTSSGSPIMKPKRREKQSPIKENLKTKIITEIDSSLNLNVEEAPPSSSKGRHKVSDSGCKPMCTPAEVAAIMGSNTVNSLKKLNVESPQEGFPNSENEQIRSIEQYGSDVQRVFEDHFNQITKVVIKDVVKEVENSVLSLHKTIWKNEKYVIDPKSPEIEEAKNAISRAISSSYINKAILVAADPHTFTRYFPELSGQYAWFNIANLKLSLNMTTKFPVLSLSGKSRGGYETLATLLQKMFDIRAKNKRCVFHQIWDAYSVIFFAIRLWKGTTEEGLTLIIDLVISFKKTFPDSHHGPENLLIGILTGFHEECAQSIDKWYEEEFSNNCQDMLAMASKFRAEKISQITQLSQPRKEEFCITDQRLQSLFMKAIAGCEHDFYTLHTARAAMKS